MPALNHATTVLFCIGATAATYLTMHVYVAPRLPLAAVDVPQVQGLSVDQARALCDPRGLLLVVDGEGVPEGRVNPGTLFAQHPLSGSRVHRGEKIHAQLAVSPQLLRVPVLAGQPLEAARARLREVGLTPGGVSEADSDTVAAGLILSTRPEAGGEIPPNQPVELQVSKGVAQVAVPNLRGQGQRAAEKLLGGVGLLRGEQHRGVDDNAAEGVVLRQSPAAGTLVPKGQKVDLWINE